MLPFLPFSLQPRVMKFTFAARHGRLAFLTPAAAAVNNSKNKKGYHLLHTLLHARC